MADELRDWWPPARAVLPELRSALLTRLATDLAVLAADDVAQRPAAMGCCWVTYRRRRPPVVGPLIDFVAPICPPRCPHVHHRHEVFLAD